MVYCFISELIRVVDKNNPYWIQRQYAIRLGKYLEYSSENDSFCDSAGRIVDPPRERIFWIGDCVYATLMDEVSKRYNLNSIDNTETRAEITNWFSHGITERRIISASKQELLDYAACNSLFFVKTLKKGWSAVVLNGKDINNFDIDDHETYVISEYREIKEDQYGNIEVRFVIIDGKILNASRCLHSLYHTIDEECIKAAAEIKSKLEQIQGFPRSFVLDVALFRDNSGEFNYDIVEINSLSTALCYVNNSFFEDVIPEIKEIYDKTGWGMEYCYDYLNDPKDYCFKTNSPEKYRYVGTQK